MRRLVLLVLAGWLALPGCSRHLQGVRPAPVVIEPAANDEKKPQRIINGESESVKNWSTGGP